MFRTIVLLCLAAPAFGIFAHWNSGLKRKYSTNMFAMGKDNLIDLPRSNYSANTQGYIKMNRPRLPPGYCSLQLWCSKEDLFIVCLFTDKTGNVVGLQYNIPVDEFEPKYDMTEQGFIIWTTVLDDYTIVRFYAFFQFFVAADFEKRPASANTDAVLRENKLYYSGFHGKMASVSTHTSRLNNTFTKQNCIGWMGSQYYYNMTKDMECTASTMSPFSVMFDSNKMIGARVFVPGTWGKTSRHKHLYEDMKSLSFTYAVRNGPKCFSKMIDQGGVAMTFFFTSTPWLIYCMFS